LLRWSYRRINPLMGFVQLTVILRALSLLFSSSDRWVFVLLISTGYWNWPLELLT
jgi:hypothetical protein